MDCASQLVDDDQVAQRPPVDLFCREGMKNASRILTVDRFYPFFGIKSADFAYA
jgi:hypothetical protein